MLNFIVDEPTAGLDVTARDELLDMLREFMEQDESRSILIIIFQQTWEPLCDDFYMIDEGKIIFMKMLWYILLSDYALLKVTPQQYTNMDKRYILKYKKNMDTIAWPIKTILSGKWTKHCCWKWTIDDVITMMSGGAEIWKDYW